MGERVGPGFTTGEPEEANDTIRFEKGNPVEGWWYVDDRGFHKVRTDKLTIDQGFYVDKRLHDRDLMEDV